MRANLALSSLSACSTQWKWSGKREMEIFKLHTLMAVRSARPLQTLIGWTDSADLRMHGPVTAKSPHYHLYRAHYYICLEQKCVGWGMQKLWCILKMKKSSVQWNFCLNTHAFWGNIKIAGQLWRFTIFLELCIDMKAWKIHKFGSGKNWGFCQKSAGFARSC